MANVPTGTKQKTYYVREDLAKVVAHIASMEDTRESDIVNEAFTYFVTRKCSTEQLKVFGFKFEEKKEKQNGNDSSDRVSSEGGRRKRRDGRPNRSKAK